MGEILNNADHESSEKDKIPTVTIHIGPLLNWDSADIVNIRNNFSCFSCTKDNPILLTISNTISFIFGAFLDNICCCITASRRMLILRIIVAVILVAATAGGILGSRIIEKHFRNLKASFE